METTIQHNFDEISFHERVAQTRWGSYISEIEREAILKAHRLASSPTITFDIGCDEGRWSKLVLDRGWKLICTDINEKALKRCQERLPTATCILANPNETTLPCETGSIGMLLCIEVSSVSLYDWIREEAARVLRPGGFYVGTFWNRRSYRGLIKRWVPTLKGPLDYYHYSYPRWREDLCKRGFTFVHEKGCCWFPFPRTSDSPLVPVATQIERYSGLHKLASLSPWVVFVAQKN